jgi:Zn-dependent protease
VCALLNLEANRVLFLKISRVGEIEIEATAGLLVLAFALVAIATLQLGRWQGWLGAALLLASLLFHEIGHLLMAQLLGVRVRAVGLCLKGAYLHRSDSGSAISEMLIAMAGPSVNLLLYACLKNGDAMLRWVAVLNLVLAVSNLVPLSGTDGARIYQSLQSLRRGGPNQERACSVPPSEK